MNQDQIAESLAEADRLYQLHLDELAAADLGEPPPPLDPATLAMPNLPARAGDQTGRRSAADSVATASVAPSPSTNSIS